MPKLLSLKLGKLPARKDAVTFKLAKYIDLSALPKPPKYFGHETLIGSTAWGMLGNDNYGDCVFAGGAHETMLWNAEAKRLVAFDEHAVLSDYAAATGFNPNDLATDNGADMQAIASYRRKTGLVDMHGTRHKVEAYLAIKPGDLAELYAALYLFGAVGMGIQFPASAMDQFNAGKSWGYVKGSAIDGGHYVPVVAKRRSLVCVTWGRTQPFTTAFLSHYNDESVAYVSTEMLTANKSLEGFDSATLLADLAKLPKG